jgi:hypothetical protein
MDERRQASVVVEFLLEHSGSLRDINESSSSVAFVGRHYV